MKRYIFSLLLVGLILTGCADKESADWKVSPTFTNENVILYGTEGKFGVVKLNGETDEPAFPADQGRLYAIYFLENGFSGQAYKITATHQDTGELVKLHEQEIFNTESQAKFGVNEAGLWKIDVAVDGKPYTDFVVEAE